MIHFDVRLVITQLIKLFKHEQGEMKVKYNLNVSMLRRLNNALGLVSGRGSPTQAFSEYSNTQLYPASLDHGCTSSNLLTFGKLKI